MNDCFLQNLSKIGLHILSATLSRQDRLFLEYRYDFTTSANFAMLLRCQQQQQ